MPAPKRPAGTTNARRLLPSVRGLRMSPPPPVKKEPKRRDDPEDPNAVKENKNIKSYYDMTPEEKKEFNERRRRERSERAEMKKGGKVKGMKEGGMCRGYGRARGNKRVMYS